MTQELKECPFCGSLAFWDKHEDGIFSKEIPKYSIGCSLNLGLNECAMSPMGIWHKKEDAIKAWNNRPSDNKDGLMALDEGHCIQYLSSQDKMRGNLSTKATVEAVYCAVRLLCSTFGTPPKRDEVSVNDIEAMINANIELKKQDYDGGIEYVIKGIEKSAQSIHRLIYGEKQEKLI